MWEFERFASDWVGRGLMETRLKLRPDTNKPIRCTRLQRFQQWRTSEPMPSSGSPKGQVFVAGEEVDAIPN